MHTATVVDVLYVDDCVLFTNTIRAIQLMIVVQFDEVSILFGMEFAISKTKIVCNQYSKAMELGGAGQGGWTRDSGSGDL